MWPRRFAANIICARTDITQAEARTLVIDAARTHAGSGVGLDTDEEQETDPPAAWTFRVSQPTHPQVLASIPILLAGSASTNTRQPCRTRF